jgi:hypothetical protein
MTAALPIRRVVLYKHGVGYFERKGQVKGARVRVGGKESVGGVTVGLEWLPVVEAWAARPRPGG